MNIISGKATIFWTDTEGGPVTSLGELTGYAEVLEPGPEPKPDETQSFAE